VTMPALVALFCGYVIIIERHSRPRFPAVRDARPVARETVLPPWH